MELLHLCFLSIFPLVGASAPPVFYPILLTGRALNPTSTDGKCGSNSESNATCLASDFGNCCSPKGFCGSESAYCSNGCQSAFGSCASASTQVISISGSCGATSTSNLTCLGSTFGDCCSLMGYCGGNSTYCGAGCQSGFGTCGSSTVPSSSTTSSKTSAPSATSVGGISTDGNCGSNSDILATCQGSDFGNCCSSLGYCGGNSSYCSTGCQPEYGSCKPSASTTISPNNSLSPTQGNPGPTSSNAVLSGGAKAGIGIGVAIFAIGVVGLIAWYVLRKRRGKGNAQEMEADLSYQSTTPIIKSVAGMHEMAQMQSDLPELPSTVTMSELGDTSRSGSQRS